MIRILTLSFALVIVSLSAHGRDTTHYYSLSEALDSEAYQGKLYDHVKLSFGDSTHSDPIETYGTYTTNKKTNAFNKSDQEACEWVLLSALIALQERALAEGGNAVVNIKSYYKKREFSSASEYECHAGAFVAGVALRGTVARID